MSAEYAAQIHPWLRQGRHFHPDFNPLAEDTLRPELRHIVAAFFAFH
jgi:hypothetical protein